MTLVLWVIAFVLTATFLYGVMWLGKRRQRLDPYDWAREVRADIEAVSGVSDLCRGPLPAIPSPRGMTLNNCMAVNSLTGVKTYQFDPPIVDAYMVYTSAIPPLYPISVYWADGRREMYYLDIETETYRARSAK